MAEETQYGGHTKIVTLTTGTSAMDGTGSTAIITATAGHNGTLLKKIHIKGQATNALHMLVRLFIDDAAGNVVLLREIDMPPQTQASINATFEESVDLNFVLKPTYKLRASISADNTGVNVMAEGLDWEYYTGAVRADTTQFTANTGIKSDATANSNLDGSKGFYITPYTAGSSATYAGSSIETITIKATVTNTPGMVRLFINDGTTAFLLKEVPIPSITPDATDAAFEHTIVFEDNLDIQAGYTIMASTENAENFNIMIEGKDWNYAS